MLFIQGVSAKTPVRTEAHQFASGRALVLLRVVSALAFGLAISTAIIIVILHVIYYMQPNFVSRSLKSAVPLILIGVAFASLQFTLRRTIAQMLLGLMVALAFILWGTEQFLPNQAVVSLIDDLVVLLFVTDLSIVIYGHLKPGAKPTGQALPFDESGE
jgi:peptidoglycan/LPS O-acetylase OafA/YrhL